MFAQSAFFSPTPLDLKYTGPEVKEKRKLQERNQTGQKLRQRKYKTSECVLSEWRSWKNTKSTKTTSGCNQHAGHGKMKKTKKKANGWRQNVGHEKTH